MPEADNLENCELFIKNENKSIGIIQKKEKGND